MLHVDLHLNPGSRICNLMCARVCVCARVNVRVGEFACMRECVRACARVRICTPNSETRKPLEISTCGQDSRWRLRP